MVVTPFYSVFHCINADFVDQVLIDMRITSSAERARFLWKLSDKSENLPQRYYEEADFRNGVRPAYMDLADHLFVLAFLLEWVFSRAGFIYDVLVS